MALDIISYFDLHEPTQHAARQLLADALLHKGIVGIRDVPEFAQKSRAYVAAARAFSSLATEIKNQYAPLRDSGDTEGYELGAEWFKNQNNEWQIDDKKASYYAIVPDAQRNKWPSEVDLRTPYLQLGELIFSVGKEVLQVLGLNEAIGLHHHSLKGYGRLLHYHKENQTTNANPDWCGAHFDHGLFTGLMPAYYFCDGQEVAEPAEAGLYVAVGHGEQFEKIAVPDQSTMLFQVGEFGQLVSHDRIRATQHRVRKTLAGIERFAFALFYTLEEHYKIQSQSTLTQDQRYQQSQLPDGSITYAAWDKASFARYRAKESA